MRLAIVSLLAVIAMSGCKNNIGDACGSSTDCSVTGERQCDLAQPGGYCTVFSCDPDTCPQGACVEWRFNPTRTAETWCMKTCDDNTPCRVDYSCVFPDQITENGGFAPESLPEEERVARIIDLDRFRAEARICVALEPGLELEVDAGM